MLLGCLEYNLAFSGIMIERKLDADNASHCVKRCHSQGPLGCQTATYVPRLKRVRDSLFIRSVVMIVFKGGRLRVFSLE